MNSRFLAVLLAAAVTSLVIPSADAATRPASKYLRTKILPHGAVSIDAAGWLDGNRINSDGVVASSAWFGKHFRCGFLRPFVYFPKAHKYVVLGKPPRPNTANTSTLGIADHSLEVTRTKCSNHRTSIYRLTLAGSTVHWSKPCACRGYTAVGINSDGIGLNNPKVGPAVLRIRRGVPKILPLGTKVGNVADARMIAVGTPGGFVGTQYDPKTRKDLPTVWLDGKPYVLPVAHSRSGSPRALGMAQYHGAGGSRVAVVGTFYSTGGCCEALGTDYWLARPKGGGFVFMENRHFIKSQGFLETYGISTDGSMIFGDSGDPGDSLMIYFPASQSEIWDPCDNWGMAWGDSRGDILISSDHLCLAQPALKRT